MAIHHRDILWKGILEDLFDDFLRFFYPDADELFDMRQGFGFMDKEIAELSPGTGLKHPLFVDKLVKVFTRSGAEEWILVHVEVQGYADHHFASRMFTYFYRIRDRYGKEVTAIAIFTDEHDWYEPDCYTSTFLDTVVTYRFKTYKVKHQDQAALEKSDNPFAVVIIAVLVAMQRGKQTPDDLLRMTTGLVRMLFRKGFPKQKIDQLLDFIKKYVHYGKPEEFAKFDTATETINKQIKSMGIKELIIWMEREEATELANNSRDKSFVTNLLAGTDFPVEKVATLANVTIDFVIEIQKELSAK
ncbi:hypothetical protein [Hufsiella ginkgonis]|uniref:Transposase (putative) YhgA-like domain-containing protein n=1 Tax=Hufsiella ginkgonis TaxID=2695274 RepID=A0A7K1Y1T7_9SPHI|nr:hypothetical protein [Hufsiella ginkgonis]MXV17223.1 hypothetical protein [Hufsiella ginkgonis]